jgi:serine/threonine-protein kinase PknK
MQLLAAGHGVGYLLKSRVTHVDEFIDTVRRVANGGSVVDPVLVQELVEARRRHDPLSVLTEREREVLALVAEGLSNDEIAGRLFLSPLTAKTHVSRIMTKLNARDRAQLVVIAYESGLVTPGGHR